MGAKILTFAQNLYCRYQEDEVPAMGAQLTYYLILAIFPFLIFLVALVSFTPLSPDEILRSLERFIPQNSNETIRKTLIEIQQSRSQTLLSFGMIATIWSASKGVDAIMKALNKAYDEEETRRYFKVKGISVLFTLALAVSIALTFVLLVFGEWIGKQIFRFFQVPDYFDTLWGIGKFAIPLAVMALVFVFLYKYIPNCRLTFKEVLPGALFSTVGWIVTSLLFSFYVNNFGNYTKTYGSLGGVIVLLTWLYLSSLIIVLGGEINATLHFDRNGKTRSACKRFSLQIPFLTKKKKSDPNQPPREIKPLYPKDDERNRNPRMPAK